MKSCADFTALLLEAEPAQLRGEGVGPLAEHLTACPRCRAKASRILAGQAVLAQALDARAARVGRDADPAVARQLGERRRWTTKRWVLGAAAPLAAAALAGVALVRSAAPGDPGEPMGPVPEWALPSTGVLGEGSLVRGGEARVAVLPTNDPDITVVWLFQ